MDDKENTKNLKNKIRSSRTKVTFSVAVEMV